MLIFPALKINNTRSHFIHVINRKVNCVLNHRFFLITKTGNSYSIVIKIEIKSLPGYQQFFADVNMRLLKYVSHLLKLLQQ